MAQQAHIKIVYARHGEIVLTPPLFFFFVEGQFTQYLNVSPNVLLLSWDFIEEKCCTQGQYSGS